MTTMNRRRITQTPNNPPNNSTESSALSARKKKYSRKFLYIFFPNYSTTYHE